MTFIIDPKSLHIIAAELLSRELQERAVGPRNRELDDMKFERAIGVKYANSSAVALLCSHRLPDELCAMLIFIEFM